VTYKVFVDDNFHYLDESERYELGEFATLDGAIEAAQKIVDEFLAEAYTPGMTFGELYGGYTSFGEDPFIVGPPSPDTGILFSAWAYAKRRCEELCTTEREREEGGGAP
jgi:hypothetical protein